MSGDASTRGWGPGWPNPDTSKIVTLNLPGFGNAQRVRQEIAPLVEWLILETERRGYHIRPDWTWGFDNRPIRGSDDEPSNHSWGLALDLNAPVNGLNYAGPGWAAQHAAGKTDMPEWVPQLWESYGFRWGGNYGPKGKRQDPMHMEFMGTPADAARYIAQIKTATQPKDWFDMATEDDLKRIVADAVKPLQKQIDAIHRETVQSIPPDEKKGVKASGRWLIGDTWNRLERVLDRLPGKG